MYCNIESISVLQPSPLHSLLRFWMILSLHSNTETSTFSYLSTSLIEVSRVL
uniref:Uncharacterized protein n=1 Tax=Arundo donax TaxID=35708 RepID=A0A0A9DEW5_ARUDO